MDINILLDKAIKQRDIRYVVIKAILEMAEIAEDDSANQLYDVAEWENLSEESDEIIFGKKIPDCDGLLPDHEDYDDTRGGEYIMMYQGASHLLISKIKEYILDALREETI